MRIYLSYQLQSLLEQPCFEQLPEYLKGGDIIIGINVN